MSQLTPGEIEAAIDRMVAKRDAVIRGHISWTPGDIDKIEADLRHLRRIAAEYRSDETPAVPGSLDNRVMPRWLREAT